MVCYFGPRLVQVSYFVFGRKSERIGFLYIPFVFCGVLVKIALLSSLFPYHKMERRICFITKKTQYLVILLRKLIFLEIVIFYF